MHNTTSNNPEPTSRPAKATGLNKILGMAMNAGRLPSVIILFCILFLTIIGVQAAAGKTDFAKLSRYIGSLITSQLPVQQKRDAVGTGRPQQPRGKQVQAAVAATFTVNDTGDAADASIGDGACATAGGVCTLRAAIAEANFTAAADTITITATGTISLSTPLPDITQSLTIDGPGWQQLLVRRSKQNSIDSGWADASPAPAAQFRIFTIPSSSLEIVIKTCPLVMATVLAPAMVATSSVAVTSPFRMWRSGLAWPELPSSTRLATLVALDWPSKMRMRRSSAAFLR